MADSAVPRALVHQTKVSNQVWLPLSELLVRTPESPKTKLTLALPLAYLPELGRKSLLLKTILGLQDLVKSRD